MENNPLWQSDLVCVRTIAGEWVHLGHVLVCQNKVVSRPVNISANLQKIKTL